MTLISGINGYVQIGVVKYSFTKWDLDMEVKGIIANNFNSLGGQQVVGGVTKADLTLTSDVYDQGNMPFTAGITYTFLLGFYGAVFISCPIFVEKISPGVDYNGAASIKITGLSNGLLTPAIL